MLYLVLHRFSLTFRNLGHVSYVSDCILCAHRLLFTKVLSTSCSKQQVRMVCYMAVIQVSEKRFRR